MLYEHPSSSSTRTTTPDPSVIGLQDSDKQLLPQFVQTAHQNVRQYPSFTFPDSRLVSVSVPSYLLEGGLAPYTFPLLWPPMRTGLRLPRQSWMSSLSTIWMAWNSSALFIRAFIFSVAHEFIAGNTPANKELVVTWYPQMIAPTSSHFYKHSVAKMARRVLFCRPLLRSHPLLAQMVQPCQMSPDLRGFSTILVRSLLPFYFGRLYLITSRRGHELRYLGILEFLRGT